MENLVGVVPLKSKFHVNSINGQNLISEKCRMVIFNYVSTFYLLPSLKNFDGIIGYDFLKEIDAKLLPGIIL